MVELSKHSRDIALELVSRIKDPVIRREAERSLSDQASMDQMVRAFHRVYGLPIIPPREAVADFSHITKERLGMRFGLIVEEFMELCEAMDLRADLRILYQDEEDNWKYAGQDITEEEHQELDSRTLRDIVLARCHRALEETDERSLPDIADACFDLKYVIIGFEYEVGIDPVFCAREGQASNMSKLAEDGSVIYREDGKVLKGPFFFPPDMAKALSAWGMKDY